MADLHTAKLLEGGKKRKQLKGSSEQTSTTKIFAEFAVKTCG